jgi:hypothetical protein
MQYDSKNVYCPSDCEETRPSLRILSVFCAIIAIIFVFASSLIGQNELPIRGTVVTENGQPIAGVAIYGSPSKNCCPYKQDEVTTDKDGKFTLEHAGTVVHFWKEGLQPRTLVIRQRATEVRMIMSEPTNVLTVSVCKPPQKGQKRIGWGKYGVQFTLPGHGVNLAGGKPDVDYVRYILKPKNGASYLEFWFGSYAIPSVPDDKLFLDSADFEQRSLAVESEGAVGGDSWGLLKNGRKWRQTTVPGKGGAIYRDAGAEESSLFDQIIDSICTIPYPKD